MRTRFLYTQSTPRPGYGSHSVASAKQASVLFDEILFERRFGVSEEVPWEEVSRRYGIAESVVAEARRNHPGTETGSFIRWVDAEEKAALEARGARLSEDSNTSEFFGDDPEAPPTGHGSFNGLPAMLEARGFEWVRSVIVAPSKLPQIPRLPGDGSWRRAARAVAQVHKASLYGGHGAQQPLGVTALALFVPDLARLPWEAIADFRAHPGSHEARHRLRDFDAKAQLQPLEAGEIRDFERHVGQEITRGLLAAWSETRPKMGPDVAKEAAKAAIGFIPLAGPALSTGTSIGQTALHLRAHDRSWLSALWNLATSAEAQNT